MPTMTSKCNEEYMKLRVVDALAELANGNPKLILETLESQVFRPVVQRFESFYETLCPVNEDYDKEEPTL